MRLTDSKSTPTGVPTVSEAPGSAARRGVITGSLAQLLLQGLSIGATLALARLLSEADFGIVAAANSILGMSGLLLSLGVTPAVVRKRAVTTEWLSTMLWCAVSLSALVAAGFVAAAPLLASLFGIPAAAPYLAALAPTVIFSLASAVPLGVLQRNLRFGRFWFIQVLAMLVYVAAQILLALVGFGPWAVVLGQLCMGAVLTAGAFILAGWMPRWILRPKLLRRDVSFAGGMLGLETVSYGVRNADYWVVGNVLGAAALGAYYVAYVLPTVLRQRISSIVGTVFMPLFAQRQDDLAGTRWLYAVSFRLQAGIGVPAMAGIAVLSEPIVLLFFGGRWDESAGPLRWIALAALCESVGTVPHQVAVAQKRVTLVVRAQLLRLTIFVPTVLLAVAIWATIESVALALAISALGWCLSQQVLLARPLGLPLSLVRRDLAAVCISAGLMALAVFVADQTLSQEPPLTRLAAGTVVGVLAYGLAGTGLFRGTFGPLLAQLKNLRRRPRSE